MKVNILQNFFLKKVVTSPENESNPFSARDRWAFYVYSHPEIRKKERDSIRTSRSTNWKSFWGILSFAIFFFRRVACSPTNAQAAHKLKGRLDPYPRPAGLPPSTIVKDLIEAEEKCRREKGKLEEKLLPHPDGFHLVHFRLLRDFFFFFFVFWYQQIAICYKLIIILSWPFLCVECARRWSSRVPSIIRRPDSACSFRVPRIPAPWFSLLSFFLFLQLHLRVRMFRMGQQLSCLWLRRWLRLDLCVHKYSVGMLRFLCLPLFPVIRSCISVTPPGLRYEYFA